MKNEAYYPPQRTRTNEVKLSTRTTFGKTFKIQLLVCVLLATVLGVIKITPEGKFLKTKNKKS